MGQIVYKRGGSPAAYYVLLGGRLLLRTESAAEAAQALRKYPAARVYSSEGTVPAPLSPEAGTPEEKGRYPLDAYGAPDHPRFWENRLADGWIFPVRFGDYVPSPAGYCTEFGACRELCKNGERHCQSNPGVDLSYGPTAENPRPRAQALAMERGRIMYMERRKNQTQLLIVRHIDSQGNSVYAQYGGIEAANGLNAGRNADVARGQLLGHIAKNAAGLWMLEFAAYFGIYDAAGKELSPPKVQTFREATDNLRNTEYDYVDWRAAGCGCPFYRRRDLIDPTGVTVLTRGAQWFTFRGNGRPPAPYI